MLILFFRSRILRAVVMLMLTVSVVCASVYGHIMTHVEEPSFTAIPSPKVPMTASSQTMNTYPADVETLTFSFVGDCMLASMLGQMTFNSFNLFASETPKEYFFSQVQSVFATDDYTVANCENVFTDRNLYAARKNYTPAYWYRSPSSYAEIFTAGSVEIASIANNHILDYGEEGRKDTIAALEAAGMLWGDTNNVIYLEKAGVKVALLCTTVTSGGYTMIWDKLEEAKAASDFQIIYFHGGIERSYELNKDIQKTCFKLVQSGADMILGHHPHVLQPIDSYYGVKIVYSLGNFLFGGGVGEDETMIYRLELVISNGQIIEIKDYPIPALCYTKENKWQPALVTDPERYNKIIEFLYMVREKPF